MTAILQHISRRLLRNKNECVELSAQRNETETKQKLFCFGFIFVVRTALVTCSMLQAIVGGKHSAPAGNDAAVNYAENFR